MRLKVDNVSLYSIITYSGLLIDLFYEDLNAIDVRVDTDRNSIDLQQRTD